MDAGAKKLLETVTIETLHANNFSRASTQATQVLTDLLSKYLLLLSATCAKYAEHAGRLRLTAQDTVSALDELGLGVEELSEYCAGEGRELSRYARHTSRRMEDLNEFKAALAVGMREDVDDAIPLVYAPMGTPPPSDDEYDEEEEEEDVEMAQSATQQSNAPMDLDLNEDQPSDPLSQSYSRVVLSPRPVTPTLPLSPISNPSTPPRKRPRTSNWDAPEYVPDFLPPFPTDASAQMQFTDDENEAMPHAQYPVKLERPVTPPPESVSSGSADYLRPTPYAQSSLASQLWHPPEAPPLTLPPPQASFLPPTEEALVYAYHHLLTNKPSQQPGPANPARYKVALELIKQSEQESRWEPPATLYASSTPNLPRVAPVTPAYPIAVAQDEKGKDGKDKGKDVDMEQFPTGYMRRTIIPNDRIAPLVGSYTSRLPMLTKTAVPFTLQTRINKLAHPPVLSRGTQKLVYGPGISAPWNSGPAPAVTPLPNGLKSALKDNKDAKDKEASTKPLADARLYATWNYEEKSFREPLPAGRRRMGSVHLTGTMGNGKRARSESHS
ncbi:hypothetical protein EIP86_006284 [Pleurotus ostreatoroseus]|nr:hypothetical protein EIP86_006284 [Pleurotus ostreatoroseus]